MSGLSGRVISRSWGGCRSRQAKELEDKAKAVASMSFASSSVLALDLDGGDWVPAPG